MVRSRFEFDAKLVVFFVFDFHGLLMKEVAAHSSLKNKVIANVKMSRGFGKNPVELKLSSLY